MAKFRTTDAGETICPECASINKSRSDRNRQRPDDSSFTDDESMDDDRDRNAEPRRARSRSDAADSGRGRASRYRDEDEEPDDRPWGRGGNGGKRQRSKLRLIILALCVTGVVMTAGVTAVVVVFANRLIGSGKTIAESEWKDLEAPNRFKVSLPGTPKRESQPAAGLEMIIYNVEYNRDTAFMVSYSEGDLPPERRNVGSEVLLNDSCDGMVRKVQPEGGVEKERESIKLGAIPGKQVVIDFPKKNGRMIARCYVLEHRLYIILAIGKGYSLDHDNVKRLFCSFEILEKSAAPPPALNPEGMKSKPAGWSDSMSCQG
jgi:hypothetical protein